MATKQRFRERQIGLPRLLRTIRFSFDTVQHFDDNRENAVFWCNYVWHTIAVWLGFFECLYFSNHSMEQDRILYPTCEHDTKHLIEMISMFLRSICSSLALSKESSTEKVLARPFWIKIPSGLEQPYIFD